MYTLMTIACTALAPMQAQISDRSFGLEHLPADWPLGAAVSAYEPAPLREPLITFPWEFAAPSVSFAAPAAGAPFNATFQESFDPSSRLHVAKLGLAAPWTTPAGTFTLDTQGQGNLTPVDGATYRTFGAFPQMQQGTARLGLQWQDYRKDEVSVSAGTQHNLVQPQPGTDDVAVSVKAMLPKVVLPWYVQGNVSSNSQQVQQKTVTLGTERDFSNGTRLTGTFGMSSTLKRTAGTKVRRSTVFNWGAEWMPEERLGVGVRVSYYPDDGEVDALLFLDIKVWPGRK